MAYHRLVIPPSPECGCSSPDDVGLDKYSEISSEDVTKEVDCEHFHTIILATAG